jgi:CRP-like cAMP-binding protein
MDTHLAAKDELRRALHENARKLGLTLRAVDIIVARVEIVTRGRGARISGPHDCPDFLRILVQGAAKIVCHAEGARSFTVRFAAPGDFLCVPQPRKADGYSVEIVAHACVTLALLTRAHMLEAIQVLPANCMGQLASWSFRNPTRLLIEKLIGRRLPLYLRLAGELKRLALRFGRPHDDGVLIDLDLSRQDLADLCCAERARITDAMYRLDQEKLAKREGRRIIVNRRLLGTKS